MNDIYSHAKASNNKAKRLFYILLLLAAFLTVLYLLIDVYKGVVGLFAVGAIVSAVLIYTKYIGVEYFYDLTSDSEDAPVFVVRQTTGKRTSTLCRLDLWSIVNVERFTAKERSTHKTPPGMKKYFYLPTLSPESVLLLTAKSEYENAEIFIEASDEFAAMLKSRAAAARESRFDDEEY